MITLETKGADLLVKQNQSFQKRLPFSVLGGIRGQLGKTVTTVRRQIRNETGIGRSKWSRSREGWINKQVNQMEARLSSDGKSVETGIRLSGMPRMLEVGGRTKKHTITGDPWLVFRSRQGKLVSVHSVNHPGGSVSAHGFARKALARDAHLFPVEVTKRIDKLIEATFGKSA